IKNTTNSIYDLQICPSTNILHIPTFYSIVRYLLLRTVFVQSYSFSSTCRAMACHSKRDEILIYDKPELILYNVNGTSVLLGVQFLIIFMFFSCITLALFDTDLDINTTIKEIHDTQ
ncbi:unnamed protein product, partial [Rotaria sp. Silwood1]